MSVSLNVFLFPYGSSLAADTIRLFFGCGCLVLVLVVVLRRLQLVVVDDVDQLDGVDSAFRNYVTDQLVGTSSIGGQVVDSEVSFGWQGDAATQKTLKTVLAT